jgi:hypothetical protein
MKTSARAPKSSLQTEAPTDTRRDSRRTSVRPNGSSHRRCRRRRPGAIVGWRPKFRKRTVRDSARRHEASCRGVRPDTVQRAHSAVLRPKTKQLGGAQPTAEIGHRSGARSLLTPSSCPKMLPPPRCPCRESLANSLPTGSRERLRRPEGHLRHRNSKRRADARRPPCGGLPTPEPARSSKHWTPDRARARG